MVKELVYQIFHLKYYPVALHTEWIQHYILKKGYRLKGYVHMHNQVPVCEYIMYELNGLVIVSEDTNFLD